MTVRVFKCDSPSTLQKRSTPYPSLALGNNLLDADNHNLSLEYVFFPRASPPLLRGFLVWQKSNCENCDLRPEISTYILMRLGFFFFFFDF